MSLNAGWLTLWQSSASSLVFTIAVADGPVRYLYKPTTLLGMVLSVLVLFHQLHIVALVEPSMLLVGSKCSKRALLSLLMET